MSEGVIVGVDGGGTHTRVVVEDPTGKELARRTLGPTSGTGRTPEEVAEWLAEGIGTALGEARCTAIFAGLAGMGRDEVRREVEALLALAYPDAAVQVGTDLDAAFFHAFGEGAGALLVAGTGSALLARLADGREVRVGGWGAILGDEGSGYALARAGMAAVVQALDGRGEATVLTSTVLSGLGIRDEGLAGAHALVQWASSATRAEIAAVAERVVSAAGQSDAVAERLVLGAARELVAHLSPPELTGLPVALAGGLLSGENAMAAAVRTRLHQRGHPLRAQPASGIEGALALARRLAVR